MAVGSGGSRFQSSRRPVGIVTYLAVSLCETVAFDFGFGRVERGTGPGRAGRRLLLLLLLAEVIVATPEVVVWRSPGSRSYSKKYYSNKFFVMQVFKLTYERRMNPAPRFQKEHFQFLRPVFDLPVVESGDHHIVL